mmetsp:Transcript_125806/g.363959  ORF Transcript_125806/g.363959 Transcript_125806/m.363959 type:complete len:212 (+) Transcript_125806:354-989(+)
MEESKGNYISGTPIVMLVSTRSPFHSRHVSPEVARSTMHAWEETATPRTMPSTLTQRHLAGKASQAHCGKVSSSTKTRRAMPAESAAPTTTQTNMSTRPFVKKSRKRSERPNSWDFASTTTFGGVAVGNRKAKEVAIVAGNINVSGFTMASTDAAASTGNMVLAVLMLDRTCEHIVTLRTTTRLSVKGCTRGMRLPTASPSATLRPEFVKP